MIGLYLAVIAVAYIDKSKDFSTCSVDYLARLI